MLQNPVRGMTRSTHIKPPSTSGSLLGPRTAVGLRTKADEMATPLPTREEVRRHAGTPHGFRRSPIGGGKKRVLDLIVASAALVAAVPLMVFIAILIRATMGGPVLFRHQRIGFGGHQFGCLKFRTMVQSADSVLDTHLKANPEAAVEWATSQKLKHDPRITFLGQVLRKSSLDELPQLFNILRGEMSCVGPRPITHGELERYGSVADDYLKARPGLTGLWQVNGRSNVDYARRVMLDAQYLSTWSLRSDLVILGWTVATVIRFEQAS